MRRPTTRLVSLLVLALATACEADPEGACDAAELTLALEAAQPGDVVRVGACAFPARVVVPPGVTLAGHGPESVLQSAGDAAVVELAEGSGAVVRDLRIDVLEGGLGVRAVGAGDATVESVSIHVGRGVGVGAQGRERVVLRATKLVGPVDASSATTAPRDPSATATYGVIAIDVGNAADRASGLRVESLRAEGFALGAVAVVGGRLSWDDLDADLDEDGRDDVDVRSVRGTAISVFEAPAEIEGVEIDSMLAGPGLPGIAIAAVDAPSMALRTVRVGEGEGYGVFAQGSTLELRGLEVRNVGLAGLRLQRGAVDAEGLVVEGARGAGLLAVDVGSIAVRGATLSGQTEALLFDDLGAPRRMADGLTVWRADPASPDTAIDLVLEDVAFEANERAGLLIDAGDTAPAISLTNVSAAAEGAAFGVVAQNAMPPAGWDDSVTRTGAAVANDVAFGGGLEIAGIIMPPALVARPGSL